MSTIVCRHCKSVSILAELIRNKTDSLPPHLQRSREWFAHMHMQRFCNLKPGRADVVRWNSYVVYAERLSTDEAAHVPL